MQGKVIMYWSSQKILFNIFYRSKALKKQHRWVSTPRHGLAHGVLFLSWNFTLMIADYNICMKYERTLHLFRKSEKNSKIMWKNPCKDTVTRMHIFSSSNFPFRCLSLSDVSSLIKNLLDIIETAGVAKELRFFNASHLSHRGDDLPEVFTILEAEALTEFFLAGCKLRQ